MTRHVSDQVLASYRERGLRRVRAARIRGHLAGCARCAGVYADLGAVSDVLAAVRLPSMPDHLAARLQGALAAEAAARTARAPGAAGTGRDLAGDPATRPAVPGRPDLPVRGKRQHRPRQRASWLGSPLALRSLAAAGAVVIVAGGGYLLAANFNPSGPASTAGSSGVSRPGPRAAAPQRQSSSTIGSLPYGKDGSVGVATAIQSRFDFEPSTLAAQVRREIANVRPQAAAGNGSTAPAPTHGPATHIEGLDLAVLGACVSHVAAGRQVLLIDVARYEGTPATVIVTAASAATRLSVTVVGAACSAGRSDVLYRVTISR
jgi:hypothetical protein